MHINIPFLVLVVCLAGALLPSPGHASDGDVQYSAPYLWVDPETGQLVTKSREPQPRSHPQEPATQADTGAGVTDAATAAPPTGATAETAVATEDAGPSMPLVLAVTLAVFAVAAALIKWLVRTPMRSANTEGYAGEKTRS